MELDLSCIGIQVVANFATAQMFISILLSTVIICVE